MTSDIETRRLSPGQRSRTAVWARAGLVLSLAGSLLLLGGCSSKEPREDAMADYRPLDADGIADAVPRAEPRSRYGNNPSYQVNGRTYYTKQDSRGHVERGIASWYGKKFHGRRTSSGEPYNMYSMTAAHKSLPLPTYVRVTNLENGRTAVVRVNDRGPFHGPRVIDLSYAAATKLGMIRGGSVPVEIRAIDTGAPALEPGTALAYRSPPVADFFAGLEPGLEPAPSVRVADNGAIAQSLAIARRGSGGVRSRPYDGDLSERAVASAMDAVNRRPQPVALAALPEQPDLAESEDDGLDAGRGQAVAAEAAALAPIPVEPRPVRVVSRPRERAPVAVAQVAPKAEPQAKAEPKVAKAESRRVLADAKSAKTEAKSAKGQARTDAKVAKTDGKTAKTDTRTAKVDAKAAKDARTAKTETKGTKVDTRTAQADPKAAKAGARPDGKLAAKSDSKQPKGAKVAGGPGVYLQVGAFGDAKNAERLRQQLSSKLGAQVSVQRPADARGSLYKVKVGPFAAADAKKVSSKLASLGVKQSKSVAN